MAILLQTASSSTIAPTRGTRRPAVEYELCSRTLPPGTGFLCCPVETHDRGARGQDARARHRGQTSGRISGGKREREKTPRNPGRRPVEPLLLPCPLNRSGQSTRASGHCDRIRDRWFDSGPKASVGGGEGAGSRRGVGKYPARVDALRPALEKMTGRPRPTPMSKKPPAPPGATAPS